MIPVGIATDIAVFIASFAGIIIQVNKNTSAINIIGNITTKMAVLMLFSRIWS
jgi:cell shape-determining protein MreC